MGLNKQNRWVTYITRTARLWSVLRISWHPLLCMTTGCAEHNSWKSPHQPPQKSLHCLGWQRWRACILCTVSRPHSDCRAYPSLHKIAEWPSARIPSRAYIHQSSNAVSPGDGVTASYPLSISASSYRKYRTSYPTQLPQLPALPTL
jgi:hypothetical protein